MNTRRLRVTLAAGLLPVGAMLAFSLAAAASVPTSVSVYGGAARAAGVHAVGGTSQYPNFASGAIDNRYPLASAGQDSSPGSHSAASPADYGPLAATVLTDPPPSLCSPPFPTTLCDNHQPPPDVYALAQYPAPPGKPEDHYSSGASDHADAYARELGAESDGTYSGGTPGSAVSQATADAHTVLDQAGMIHVKSHAHVSSAGIGPLTIKNVDVVVEVTSANGVAKATAVVNAGDVNDGKSDHPVSPDGTKQHYDIPGLVPTTVTVFAVKPDDRTSGDTGSITATGTHVVVDQPAALGQYSHHIEYVFGEAFAQGFVKPSGITAADTTSSSTSPLGGGDGGSIGSVTTDTVTTNPGLDSSFTGAAPSDVTGSAHKATTPVARHARVAFAGGRIPLPLASMFFLWEAMVLGAAASTVWARRAARVQP
ncbi:MAG: hypothetical protein ABR598_09305 [Candidatus Dormibacteria bacterium]